MTYEKISKFRVSRTHQCGDVVIERGRWQRRSRISVNESVRSLEETSVSIHSRRLENKTESANSRGEDSIYRKASQEPGFFHKAVCQYHGQFIKQYSYASSDCISQEKAAWPRDIVKGKFRCFTRMIAWAIVRFHKFIDCWFQKKFGYVVEANRP